MSFYGGMATTALKMIKDKGRAITIRMPGEGEEYNPDTDTFTPVPGEDIPTKGVFTQFALKDVDGELILRTDKRLLIAAADLLEPPSTTAKIVDGGTQYNVINTEVVQPGDTAILYMVQVRK